MRASILIGMVAVVGCGPSMRGSFEDSPALLSADPGYAASYWVGPRVDGAACADDAQCRSGKCTATAVACGVCEAWNPMGSGCRADSECSRTAVCTNHVCVSTKKLEGAECALQPKGGDLGECDLELVCVRGPAFQKGICRRPLPLGSACGPGTVCRAGTKCSDAQVCVPFALPVAGESCAAIYCAPGLRCNAAKTCEPRGVLALGDLCGVNDGVSADGDCPTGTACGNLAYPNGGGPLGTQSTCVALPTEGNAAINYHCAPGLFAPYTEGTNPICQPLLGEGGACGGYQPNGSPCAAGLECRFGACRPVCQ